MAGERGFEQWLTAYGAAWEARDRERFVALFTPDATYQWTPFEEPKRGRHEIGRAFWDAVENQRKIAFRSQVLSVNDGQGICRWWCEFDRTDGSHTSLDGIFVCQMTSGGQCSAFQEWWHRVVS